MRYLLRLGLATSVVLALIVPFIPTEQVAPPTTSQAAQFLEVDTPPPASVSLSRSPASDPEIVLARSNRAPGTPPGQDREPPGQVKKTTTTTAVTTTSTVAAPTTTTSPPPTTTSTAAPTTTSTSTTTAPSTTTTTAGSFGGGSLSSAVTVRGIYGRDSSGGTAGLADAGFNTVLAGASRNTLDDLAAKGLKAVVWLGNYHRSSACAFEYSDAQVSDMVSTVAGHPAIAAYLLADEPTYAFAGPCPEAPDDLRRRSELVKALDPSKPTMVTLTTWDGREAYPYSYWVGTADIFGLVAYPCSQGDCDFEKIDQAASVADSVGLGEYWAIIQDFADSWYDLPSADEVNEQFVRWSKTNMTGYLVFAADGFSCCRASDFETNPGKRAVLEAWNRS